MTLWNERGIIQKSTNKKELLEIKYEKQNKSAIYEV